MQVEEWSPQGPWTRGHRTSPRQLSLRFASAVSLHAHTHHSNEVMASVPGYLNRVPIVSGFFQRESQRYVDRHGEAPDFGKGWWHPPVGPEEVLDAEADQIVDDLGLVPLVSITDHDSIVAGLELQASRPGAPVSFEWTIPYGPGFFHLGVHNLPPCTAASRFAQLAAFTGRTGKARLADLLGDLEADPHVLIVLNHPLWDLAGVGIDRHHFLLSHFLDEHHEHLHALEINGYRSRPENRAVDALAERRGLPVISGGDRHGYEPNSVVNLTRARCFNDFVREVREDLVSEIAVMPHYRRPLVARKLAVAADVVRANRSNPPGQRRWTDRVSYDQNGVVCTLSRHWPTGGPFWVRWAIRTFLLLTSAPLLPLLAFVTMLVISSPADASESIGVHRPGDGGSREHHAASSRHWGVDRCPGRGWRSSPTRFTRRTASRA